MWRVVRAMQIVFGALAVVLAATGRVWIWLAVGVCMLGFGVLSWNREVDFDARRSGASCC
jgi:hypothetical protein